MNHPIVDLKNYFVVTAGYWTFTITDGAIRMLVVLYFHQLGYAPLDIALLFLFYEIFGVVTNLVGGWLGSRIGLNLTMHIGMGMQVVALALLAVPDAWLSVPYVMMAQALSGIAKDLNKMSAKASVKLMLPKDENARLFKWVAVLTGSKNALKGLGFFIGGFLLSQVGFRWALLILAALLLMTLVVTAILLPGGIGKTKAKPKFTELFSKTPEVNWLSAARFFLFASRDVWFVVGVPVFLTSTLGWGHTQVGGFLALWVIGYGFVQAVAPRLLRKEHHHHHGPDGGSATLWVFVLALFPAAIALALQQDVSPTFAVIAGLSLFGAVFAVNSALHSYLILAYSDHDKVALNVGFYYMANAGGRLAGTVLSGLIYQLQGLEGCLWWSTGLLFTAGLLSIKLPRAKQHE
ncbi:MAG: organoarsenical effux MFS transporter ArsJ [Candidatus Sedimenticola sp. (ex Thyasira tokunagai)]